MNIKLILQGFLASSLFFLVLSSCKKTEVKEELLASETDMISNPDISARIPSSFKGLFISRSQYSRDMSDTEISFSEVPNTVAGDMIWVHIENGPSATSYQPRSWVHVDNGADASKYTMPNETEHMTTGPNATQQGPVGFTHVTTGPGATTYAPSGTTHVTTGADATKYSVQGYIHITEGPNKTYYKKYVRPIIVIGGGTDIDTEILENTTAINQGQQTNARQ